MPINLPPQSDTILIDTLQLAPSFYTFSSPPSSSTSSPQSLPTPTQTPLLPLLSCWHSPRPQPLLLTLALHLQPLHLHKAAVSDDVKYSVNYGVLVKRVGGLVERGGASPGEDRIDNANKQGFKSPQDFIRHVAAEAYTLATPRVLRSVSVELMVPKYVLLAEGFRICAECVYAGGGAGAGEGEGKGESESEGKEERVDVKHIKITHQKVHIGPITLPVIIGVNKPERMEKQRVVLDLTFYEDVDVPLSVVDKDGEGSDGGGDEEKMVDYQKAVGEICEALLPSTHLTLESLASQALTVAFQHTPKVVGAVGVKVRKPSAVLFASGGSGVEVVRRREG
ncbi:hypothetical protein CVT24_011938 [Panaeolus cyanescens]|uniref:dihydroneopterin aldolase n=1 Tax=Panaeolus cyanescens TaxID=181874 RepID=A0A409W5W6_9AGAR|nr:hypothetical protein CVT24_011938 [Panaeolus cyanescens]